VPEYPMHHLTLATQAMIIAVGLFCQKTRRRKVAQ
jgi:hypothetical protein